MAHARQGLIFLLVPSARLELAQLSPLPPQDSVSTNFTTTAVVAARAGMRRQVVLASRTAYEFTPKRHPRSNAGALSEHHLTGICPTPEAARAGGADVAGAAAGAL